MHAGLDVNPAGVSLVAQFKRDRHPLFGNLHCVCHLLNLLEKAAFNKAELWVQQWFDHIKAVFHSHRFHNDNVQRLPPTLRALIPIMKEQ